MKAAQLLALAVPLSLFSAQTNPASTRELNEGVNDFKTGRFSEAAPHFQQALNLDPSNTNAQLYLASNYFAQWTPGADTPENPRFHDLAVQQFEAVLEKDPNSSFALAMMAAMAYDSYLAATAEQKSAAINDAVRWNQRRIAANPRDPEPYYYLGVLAWSGAFVIIQRARVQLKMSPNEPGPLRDPALRGSLKSQLGAPIDEGLANLHKSVELDPKNGAAMSYLNLLLRKKADLEDSTDAAKADISQATEWFRKSLANYSTLPAKWPPASGELVPPSPPPPPPPPPLGGAQRIGGAMAEKNIVHKVQPIYPEAAKAAQVQGIVEFTVVINEEGAVERAQLVRGDPLLVDAAKEALLQWKYRPVLLHGQPVKIITDVVINFVLGAR